MFNLVVLVWQNQSGRNQSSSVSIDWIVVCVVYWLRQDNTGGIRPPCFMNSFARMLAFLEASCFSDICISSRDFGDEVQSIGLWRTFTWGSGVLQMIFWFKNEKSLKFYAVFLPPVSINLKSSAFYVSWSDFVFECSSSVLSFLVSIWIECRDYAGVLPCPDPQVYSRNGVNSGLTVQNGLGLWS